MKTDYRLKTKGHRLLFLPIVSAVLLILAYPNFNFELLAWVAFIPLFFAIENKNAKTKFATGYFFGLIFFSGLLYWLFNISVPGAITLVLILPFFPAIFCSFCPALSALRPWHAFFVPAAWVFTEYLRGYLFTGFPWALLGYSQSRTLSVIQIADITGVWGVSFLVMLVNYALYLAFRRYPRRFYILLSVFLIFAVVLIYGENRLRRPYPSQELKVALIQGNIPQEEKWDPRYRRHILDIYVNLTEDAAREKPVLAIWPETALPGYLEGEPDLENRIRGLARKKHLHLLVGTLKEEDSRIYNSATLISDKGDTVKSYSKIHRVPFGEYIPFEGLLSGLRSFIDKPIGAFDRGREFTVFRFKAEKTTRHKNEIRKITEFYKFSSLICFEDIFPGLSRRFVKNGARFLVNITNDAWFGKTAAPYQHLQGSVFRAVENRVPVVRAANTGISCAIEHTGRIKDMVKKDNDEIFVEGYITPNVRPVFSKTVYTRFGDVFAWFCGVFALFGLLLRAGGKARTLLLIFLSLAALSANVFAQGETYGKGKFKFNLPFGKRYDYNSILVRRVIDGDTVEIENGERVRLIGIDTPETRYNRKLKRDAGRTKKDMAAIIAIGKKATKFTKSLVLKKKVRLEFDVEKKDRYGRLLAYVYLPDGRMLNARLVEEGYAQVYTFPPNVKYAELFVNLQREAREYGRGFWK